VVTGNADEAYAAMHDVGDVASVDTLPAQELINALLAEAYLVRDGRTLPDWLRQGFGMTEAGLAPKSAYAKNLPSRAASALSTVTDPASLFNDGTLGPDEVGPVGFLLVRYLLTRGGPAKLSELVKALSESGNVGRAIQQTYGVNAANLGAAFLRSGGR
jgi:hypothetical protein